MEIFKHFNETQNVYMELTHRIHGGEGWDFGSVLWSPAYGKRRDTWGIMRDVKANDIIIHSLKGEHGHARTIDGISLVQQSYYRYSIASILNFSKLQKCASNMHQSRKLHRTA